VSEMTIRLDQDCRTIIQRVASDSRLTCVRASAPDVYARGIVTNEQQRELRPEQSMTVKGGSRLTIRLFRTRDVDEPFSVELSLAPQEVVCGSG
jgi:hypothetical protein